MASFAIISPLPDAHRVAREREVHRCVYPLGRWLCGHFLKSEQASYR